MKSGIQGVVDEWHPGTVLIENAHWGKPLANELKRCSTQLMGTQGKGKLERSTKLQNMLERGQVHLPLIGHVAYAAEWLNALQAEWFSWTGHEDETSDQIDTASMAANFVGGSASGQSWGGVVENRLGAIGASW